jgi:hypothetical protein
VVISPRRNRLRRLPAFETIAGWARLMGISSYKVGELVKAANVEVRQRGRMKVVYLIDWRRMDSDLFESLRLARQASEEDAA